MEVGDKVQIISNAYLPANAPGNLINGKLARKASGKVIDKNVYYVMIECEDG